MATGNKASQARPHQFDPYKTAIIIAVIQQLGECARTVIEHVLPTLF